MFEHYNKDIRKIESISFYEPLNAVLIGVNAFGYHAYIPHTVTNSMELWQEVGVKPLSFERREKYEKILDPYNIPDFVPVYAGGLHCPAGYARGPG